MALDFETEFFNKIKRVNQASFLKRLSERTGVIAVNFTKERFRHKDWYDTKRNPWKPRKNKSTGELLLKSGRLKRSIRKLSSGRFFVYIGTDVPYAQIHNEGGHIKQTVSVRSHRRRGRNRAATRVRSHRRKMNTKIPKRQFLGTSEALVKRIDKYMRRAIKKELK